MSATKLYVVLPDRDAERDGDLRVVDESGEDYLFSADRFVAIDVPATVKASLLKAHRVLSATVPLPPKLFSLRRVPHTGSARVT